MEQTTEPGNTPETEQKQYMALEHFASEADPNDYTPGAPAPAEPEPELGASELAFLFDMTFSLVASRRGAHWKLDPEESKALGEATDKVMEKYLPGMKAGPEVVLLLTAGALVAPRLMQDGERQEDEPEPDAEGGTDGD